MPSSSKSSIEHTPSSLPYGEEKAPTPKLVTVSPTRTYLTWFGLFPTAFIIFITAGLATLIHVWLHLSAHDVSYLRSQPESGFWRDPNYFTIYEGTKLDWNSKSGFPEPVASMRLLTFSSVASHLMGTTSSFLMTLVAYRYASCWLEMSRSGMGSPHDFPTPLQYGLLLRIFGSPNIIGLYKAADYARQKDRPRLPKLFIEPLIISSIVFFLTHLYGGGDLWLHTASRSTSAYPSFKQDLTLWPNASKPSVDFDWKTTGCDNWSQLSWPCLNTATGWAQEHAQAQYIQDGIATALNSSTSPLSIITLNNSNDSAILLGLTTNETYQLGPEWPDDTYFEFTMNTAGARADCDIITSQCTSDASGLTTTCAGAGYPQLPVVGGPSPTYQGGPQPPFTSLSNSTYNTSSADFDPSSADFTIPSRVLGVVHGNLAGTDLGVSDLPPTDAVTNNPATLLVQLRWASIYNRSEKVPSFDTYPTGYHTLYAACQLEYFTGLAQFDPQAEEYSLQNHVPVPSQLASILWSPLLAQYATDALTSIIQNVAITQSPDDVRARLNQEVARMAIALPSGLFTRGQATSVEVQYLLILGQYPKIVVYLLTAILYLYSATAIVVFITSHTASSYAIIVPKEGSPADEKEQLLVHEERPALELAQMWLTDPIPLLASTFPERDGEDGMRSTAKNSLRMIADHSEENRLQIGVYDRGGEAVFGLKTRSTNTGA